MEVPEIQDKDAFYEELERTIDNVNNRNVKNVQGNFNTEFRQEKI